MPPTKLPTTLRERTVTPAHDAEVARDAIADNVVGRRNHHGERSLKDKPEPAKAGFSAGTPHGAYDNAPWQCLYFLPDPQGQASLRPTLPHVEGSSALRALFGASSAAGRVSTSVCRWSAAGR